MLHCHTTLKPPFTLLKLVVTLLLNDTEDLKSLLYSVAWVDPGKYRKDLFQVSVVMTYTVPVYATGAGWLLLAVVLTRHFSKRPLCPDLQILLYSVCFLAYSSLQGAAV